MDLRLPDLDGISVIEQIRHEELPTRTLIVSANDDSALVYRAISAGANAYLSKMCDANVLYSTVMAVGRGETVIPAALQAGLAKEIRARRVADQPVLTARRWRSSVTSPMGFRRRRSPRRWCSVSRRSRRTFTTSTRSSRCPTVQRPWLKRSAEGCCGEWQEQFLFTAFGQKIGHPHWAARRLAGDVVLAGSWRA